MSIFRDALAPLSARMVREHNVLHIAADLPDDTGVIDAARNEILKWAQKRSGGQLPHDAMEGRSFDLLAAGRNSSAVNVDLPEIRAWGLRQEDPDKTVAQRIWTAEAIIWRAPDGPLRLAARLIVNSPEAELDIAPAIPGFVHQLVDNVGLMSGGWDLFSRPWYIGDEQNQDRLINHLADPARRLPVVMFSVLDAANSQLAVNIEALAKGLCGLAEVAAILPGTSWALTQRFGKRLSVFEGAARIYMPGFDEVADPFGHPLWLGARLATPDGAAQVERQIRTRVAQFSTRAVRMGEDILPFAQLRSIARKAEQDRLASSGASDEQQLKAALDRIRSLEIERDEVKQEAKGWTDEAEAALKRAEEAEQREYNAITRVQSLLEQLSSAGVAGDNAQDLPDNWSVFEAWCDEMLAGKLTLTAAARRGCKKALYTDVRQAARCLLWLAEECRSRRISGGGSLRDEAIEEGIRNAPCGSDTFTFDWKGQRLYADWHVKTGGNSRAPENCLRIYYGWDEHAQQIVIADMPAHRKTGAS